MTTCNDVTGDRISSKTLSKEGRDNWDNIFGKKDKEEPTKVGEEIKIKADSGTGSSSGHKINICYEEIEVCQKCDGCSCKSEEIM